MADEDVLALYYQGLYDLILNRLFTFTIGGNRVKAEEFRNYLISNYRYEHMSMVEKALKTRMGVSRETLKGQLWKNNIE